MSHPALCTPNFERADIPRLQGDMLKWKSWLTSESQIQWESFFNDQFPSLSTSPQDECAIWPWQKLIERTSHGCNTSNNDQNQELQELFAAEDEEPHVSNNLQTCNLDVSALLVSTCFTDLYSSIYGKEYKFVYTCTPNV